MDRETERWRDRETERQRKRERLLPILKAMPQCVCMREKERERE